MIGVVLDEARNHHSSRPGKDLHDPIPLLPDPAGITGLLTGVAQATLARHFSKPGMTQLQ